MMCLSHDILTLNNFPRRAARIVFQFKKNAQRQEKKSETVSRRDF